MNENILDDDQVKNLPFRRRDLLPTWIKVFVWIFLIFGAIIPFTLILGIIGMDFNISLYGLETMEPLSVIGLFVAALFLLKGIVAFGLWTEQKWAVSLAIIDAIIGIVVCVFVMIVFPFVLEDGGLELDLRLELVLLIPYLMKMKKIESEWADGIALNE